MSVDWKSWLETSCAARIRAARRIRRVALLFLGLVLLSGTVPAQEVIRVIAMPEATGDSSPSGQGLTIDDELLRNWRRLRDDALAQGAGVIVLEITTPGGYVATGNQFVADLQDLHAQGIRTVAYIPQHATSCGAILALACREILMAPGATMGNVIPLEMRGFEGFQRAPEKVVTELRSLMSRLAKQGGHPEKLLHAMVDAKQVVYEVRIPGRGREYLSRTELDARYPDAASRERLDITVVVPDNAALKVDLEQGQKMGFPLVRCDERKDIRRALKLGSEDLESSEVMELPKPEGWNLQDLRLPGLGTVLLVLGVIFVILGIKTPGLGLFEGLALLSFIAYFGVTTTDTNWFAFTTGLLLLGFLLLIAEFFFFPGFGVPGIAGLCLILLSIYAASIGLPGEGVYERLVPQGDAEWAHFRDWWLLFMGATAGGSFGALWLTRFLHRIPFLNRAFLTPPVLATEGGAPSGAATPGATSDRGIVTLRAGAEGTTETPLRPSGRARFHEGVVSVVSSGAFIPKGERVRVLKIEGNRVVVAPEEELA